MLQGIRQRCRDADAELESSSKVVSAAKGAKNMSIGGGLIGGGVINAQIFEAEKAMRRKLKELNQQVRLRNTHHNTSH